MATVIMVMIKIVMALSPEKVCRFSLAYVYLYHTHKQCQAFI